MFSVGQPRKLCRHDESPLALLSLEHIIYIISAWKQITRNSTKYWQATPEKKRRKKSDEKHSNRILKFDVCDTLPQTPFFYTDNAREPLSLISSHTTHTAGGAFFLCLSCAGATHTQHPVFRLCSRPLVRRPFSHTMVPPEVREERRRACSSTVGTLSAQPTYFFFSLPVLALSLSLFYIYCMKYRLCRLAVYLSLSLSLTLLPFLLREPRAVDGTHEQGAETRPTHEAPRHRRSKPQGGSVWVCTSGQQAGVLWQSSTSICIPSVHIYRR